MEALHIIDLPCYTSLQKIHVSTKEAATALLLVPPPPRYLCKVFHENIMSSSRWKNYILVPIVLTVIRQLIIYLQGKLPTTPGPLIACLLIVREAESPIFYFSFFFRSVRSFAKSGIKIAKYF